VGVGVHPAGHHQQPGHVLDRLPHQAGAHSRHPAVGPDEHVRDPLAVHVEHRSAPQEHGATQPHGRPFTNQ
jgi:hypothetical protein